MQKTFLHTSPGKECLANEICVQELEKYNCIVSLISGLIEVAKRMCGGKLFKILERQRLK